MTPDIYANDRLPLTTNEQDELIAALHRLEPVIRRLEVLAKDDQAWYPYDIELVHRGLQTQLERVQKVHDSLEARKHALACARRLRSDE